MVRVLLLTCVVMALSVNAVVPSWLIAIGVSADGFQALAAILRDLPPDFPAARS